MHPSTKPILKFVNLSHPDELKDEETQLRIRRLAMSEVGRARRKLRTKHQRNEMVLEFRKSAASPLTIDRLGGGEVDPFSPYPIDLDATSRGLIASIFRENSAHTRQLRGAWWLVGLAGKAAFFNVLANARLYQLKELTGTFTRKDDSLSLTIQSNAIRSMSEQMKSSEHHSSDEMIGAVSSFMCHHHVLGVFAGWEHHRNAMARMIGLRGGFDNITQEPLRLTISWTDLVGSFSQDIPSIVPLPQRWQNKSQSPPGSPRPTNNASLLWKQRFPALKSWITIFDDIDQLILLDRGLSEDVLKLAESSGCWIEPTMVRLLAIRPLARGTDPEHIIEEVCRLGTMLFLAPIWRWIGASPVWTFNITRNLLSTLNSYMVEWSELKPLLVWSVYFAALETRDPQERSQFVFFLAVLMGGLQIQDWSELMRVVKSVLWVERVFSSSDDDIRDEILSTLRLPMRDLKPVQNIG